MAKGQMRSTRETRKPKKDKPKAAPAARSPIGLPEKGTGEGGKKK